MPTPSPALTRPLKPSLLPLRSPWWNPAIEDQALARVHRMGQTRQVYVRRLVARKTIEEQLIEIQEAKRAIATSVLSAGAGGGGAPGAGGAASKLTEEDLRTFFVR